MAGDVADGSQVDGRPAGGTGPVGRQVGVGGRG